MRFIKIAIIGLFMMSGLSSCEKDTPAQTTAEKILGKWSFISKTISNGTAQYDKVEMGQTGDYYHFTTNAKVLVKIGSDPEQSLSYTCDNIVQISIDGEPYLVLQITSNTLELKKVNQLGNVQATTNILLGR